MAALRGEGSDFESVGVLILNILFLSILCHLTIYMLIIYMQQSNIHMNYKTSTKKKNQMK